MTELAPSPAPPASSPGTAVVPEAPPPPEWVAAEAAVEALVEALDATARAEWTRWTDAVATDVTEPLRAVLRRVSTAHRALAEQVALDDTDGPAKDRWRRITAYRAGVTDRVLTPLRTHLHKHRLGSTLGAGWLGVRAPLETLADDAPPLLTLPAPITLYASDVDDALVRRFYKATVRARHHGRRAVLRVTNGIRRLARRTPRPLPARGRPVHVRALCAYHVHVRLVQALAPFHEAVQRHAARIVGRIETALTDWTHAVLDVESATNRVAFHHPAALHTLPATREDTPEAPLSPDACRALAAAADALQQALDSLGDALTPPDLEATAPLSTARQALAADLRRAGTFALRRPVLRIPAPEHGPATEQEARAKTWSTWHEQAADRLTLNRHLLVLRNDLLRLEDALLNRIARATLRPVLDTFQPLVDRLRAAEQQAGQACDEAAAADDLQALASRLRTLQGNTLRTLQNALSDLPGLVSADQALAEPGLPEWRSLHTLLEALPEPLYVHAPPRGETPLTPERRPWRMMMGQGARDVLHPFAEQLAEPAQPLRKQIVQVWGQTEQVLHIVQYNLDVALDELTAAERPAPLELLDETEAAKSPLENARELSTDGLRRAADTLSDMARSLEPPWHTFAAAVVETFRNDWADVHRIARTEAFVEEQWFDLVLRGRRWLQRTRRRSKEGWHRYSHSALRLLRLGRRRAQRIVERGRSAMGATELTEAERLRTIDAISLSTLRALQGRLPLVYRKLFSFQPVVESSLLEGRAPALKRVTQHFQRWQKGQAIGAFILQMPFGSGRTSLLNVVRTTLQPEADVRILTLDRRILDATALAEALAEALNLDAGNTPTLDALEARIASTSRPEPPCVCLIDNLEHLLLRAFGGIELIERALTFFSRTDSHVYWVATIGADAWQFIEKTAGNATGLAMAYTVGVMDARTLEAVILNRHRRSGMVLRFAEPPDLTPLVRQRLRRARTTDDQQAILRELYFDRLSRLSGQNIMLALFYWLRSADFETEAGILTVRPIEPLNFGFFQTFDLTHAFTLKAFMLHNTLTLDEHNRVFHMTDAQSLHILESLLNLGLIEPVYPEAAREMNGTLGCILPGVRYRLHPLILHPTLQLLRAQNIVH